MVFTSSVMKMYKFLLSYNRGLSKDDEDHLSWLMQVVGQGLTTCYLSYEIIKAVASHIRYPAILQALPVSEPLAYVFKTSTYTQ